MATVGLAIASLFPNANKVSFMGAKDSAKNVVASVEKTAEAVEPVVEKVAQSAGSGAGRAVAAGAAGVAGAGAVASKFAAEKSCVTGAKALVGAEDSAAHAIETGIARDVGETAPKVGTELGSGMAHGADDAAELKVPQAGKEPLVTPETNSLPRPEPLPGRGLIVVPEAPVHSVARAAVEASDFKILSADPEAVFARQVLHAQSIDMTQSVLEGLPRNQLLSHDQVAKVFNASLTRRMYHATLDPFTGVVRMNIQRNGVTIAAEFNVYSAAEAAAAILAAPPVNSDRPQRPGGRSGV